MLRKLVVLLGLVALLLSAGGAQAAATGRSAPTMLGQGAVGGEGEEEDEGEVWEEIEDEGEGEVWESECEEAGEELAAGEISGEERNEVCKAEAEEWERASAVGILPEACVVRTFDPSAVVIASRNQVQLTIAYTAYEPTVVTIGYGLGIARRHLGAQGVLHFNKRLGPGQAEKLHRLVVKIAVPAAPPRCRRLYSGVARVHPR